MRTNVACYVEREITFFWLKIVIFPKNEKLETDGLIRKNILIRNFYESVSIQRKKL